MSEAIDYSVVIRTTGKAGEKYQRLLESVACLEPAPREVIVVLPEGYDLPEEQLGWETFYFCPRGMVIQRMTGIAKCKSRYALICDDDVMFGSDFVRQLYRPVEQGICTFSAGHNHTFQKAQAPFPFHRPRSYAREAPVCCVCFCGQKK